MKRIAFSICAAALIATSFGCATGCNSCCQPGCGLCNDGCGHTGSCGTHGCGLFGGKLFGGCNHCGTGGMCGHGDMCGCDPYAGCGPHGGHGHHGYGNGYGNGGGFLDQMRYRHQGEPGPASAAVVYPYYTTRGPRDFLAAHPRDIGP